ncbi:MAG: hypothetical protein HY435_01985 [Candidatus Liptonbacteria bacterium]|nr:hypothetical protein [Candidatus Liptonbacteria bacterium]
MRYARGRSGITFLEIVIVMGIFAGVLFVISSFVTTTSQFENLVNQKLEVRQDLEQTFQVLVTEIRSMGSSNSGAYPIGEATTSTLAFYSDIDSDGIYERVRYSLSTSTINRGVIEPTGNPLVYATSTETIAIAVEKVVSTTAPIFEYYDKNFTGSGAPLSYPLVISNIRMVKVQVFADASPRAPKPVLFSDLVNIRNLRGK